MFGSQLQLTPETEVEFLKKYRDDVTELNRLKKDYEAAAKNNTNKSNSGNVTEYVQEYADKNNALLNAHEAVQKKISEMQASYKEYGIPKAAALGHINDQVAFLHNLEVVKKQAVDNLRAADADNARPAINPDDKKEHQSLCNFADSTNKPPSKPMTFLEDKQKKQSKDSLSHFYQNMWQETYKRDRRYAERLHRAALKGRGRTSAYDINEKWGRNLQFDEFWRWNSTENLGIDTQLGSFKRTWVKRTIPSSLGGTEKLGQYTAQFTQYKDSAGGQLLDPNGKPVVGGAEYLSMVQVSIYGGYGTLAKSYFSRNEQARVMQCAFYVGSFLSSMVNNSAILLDVEAIKNNPNLTEDHKKSLIDAQADAESAAKNFMANGFTWDKLAPGYGGMDAFYQMQSMAKLMGVPFNQNGPTLEKLLQDQIDDAGIYRPHLRRAAQYALWQVQKNGARMEAAADKKAIQLATGTKEYRSLLKYTVTRTLMDKYMGYKDCIDGTPEKKLYDKYQKFEADFEKNHAYITDPEKYAKAFAKAMKSEFGSRFFSSDYGDAQKALENPQSPGFLELCKNALGAHTTGREDWYRRVKHMPKDNVTADNKNDAEEKVTATNAGDPTNPLVLSKGRASEALNKAMTIGGGTSQDNHNAALAALNISNSDDPNAGLGVGSNLGTGLGVRGNSDTGLGVGSNSDTGLGVVGASAKLTIPKEEPAQSDDNTVNIVADVKSTPPKPH